MHIVVQNIMANQKWPEMLKNNIAANAIIIGVKSALQSLVSDL